MAVDEQTTPKPPPQTHLATAFQTHRARRRIFFLRPRRNNKLPTVRLGGRKKRGLFIASVLRKIRWVRLQYTCMLRKLKNHYRKLIKDLIEASASAEAFQQRMLMESTFAVPVMGVSLSTFPSGSASSDRPKPLLF